MDDDPGESPLHCIALVTPLIMMDYLFCLSVYGLPYIVVAHLLMRGGKYCNSTFAKNNTSTTDAGFTMYLLRTPCLSSLVNLRVLYSVLR